MLLKDFTKKQAWVFLLLWITSYIIIELVYNVLISYVIQVAVEIGTVPTLINFQSFILYTSLHTLEIVFYGFLLGIIQQQLFQLVLLVHSFTLFLYLRRVSNNRFPTQGLV